MQVTITIGGENEKEFVNILGRLSTAFSSEVAVPAPPTRELYASHATLPVASEFKVPEPLREPQKRHRRTKAEIEAAKLAEGGASSTVIKEVEARDESEDATPAGDEYDTAEVDLGDAPTPTKKALDLDDDIIPAFQKYAAKHSRDKAAAVLAKFGVKSVRNLGEDKYVEVLKLLKV